MQDGGGIWHTDRYDDLCGLMQTGSGRCSLGVQSRHATRGHSTAGPMSSVGSHWARMRSVLKMPGVAGSLQPTPSPSRLCHGIKFNCYPPALVSQGGIKFNCYPPALVSQGGLGPSPRHITFHHLVLALSQRHQVFTRWASSGCNRASSSCGGTGYCSTKCTVP